MRPLQWAKNLFVFLPMFFSGNLLNPHAWVCSVIVFVAFSLTASAVYCLNDIRDAEADRQHPRKCRRPIASGAVSPGMAWGVMGVLLAGGMAVAWLGVPATHAVWFITGVYFLLNLGYCLGFKNVAIVDVFIVATGFVLRVVGGGEACGIWVSPWLICMTFLLALFLAFAKRRDDVVLMEREGIIARRNIVRYNSTFLDQTLGIIAAVTMMSYIMYTVSPEVEARFGCRYVYISAVFVLAGVLRYLQVTMVDNRSGSPTRILMRDRFVQVSVVCWVLFFVGVIYL